MIWRAEKKLNKQGRSAEVRKVVVVVVVEEAPVVDVEAVGADFCRFRRRRVLGGQRLIAGSRRSRSLRDCHGAYSAGQPLTNRPPTTTTHQPVAAAHPHALTRTHTVCLRLEKTAENPVNST